MKYVLRRLMHSPLFTATTILTLAIGIGANTAIFSVVQGVLLKPLPYPNPHELISVQHAAPGVNAPEMPSAPSNYFVYRDENKVFQDIALWTNDSFSITGVAEPQQIDGMDVTDGLLPILGVQPVLGRLFTAKDDSPGSPLTAMISYGYWQRNYGGDRSVIGRTITADSRAYEIIGVLPQGFQVGDRSPQMIVTLQFNRAETRLGNFSYQSIARLKPGATITEARTDIARMIPILFTRFAPPGPNGNIKMFEDARLAPNLKPLKDYVIGDIGNILWVLMGTIGIVLLIACANVANLLLVRAEGRQQELAIRTALGASQGRLAADLLLESVTLGILGGAIGLALAYAALQGLVAMAPRNLPRLAEIGIDTTVLLFALGVSVLSGVLFGLIPIFKYAGSRIAGSMRQGGRGLSQSRERHRARSVLVIAQVALALVLLIGAGLMIRTFEAMRTVQPGFSNPEQVQAVSISIPSAQVKDPEAVFQMQRAILEKIQQIPGVISAAFGSTIPMDGNQSFDPIWPEDRPFEAGKLPPMRRYKFTSPGMFATIGNPLLAGRDYTWEEIQNRVPVTIVSENLAKEYWGSARAALGKRIRETPVSPWREIVGVSTDVRDGGVDQPAPLAIFWPMMTRDFQGNKVNVRRGITYAVRTTRAGSQSLVNEIRQAVWSVNPNVPLERVRTLEQLYTRSMARTSFALVMLALAGGMALLLGVIGIYGVISYSVSQRTREIGIRMALGAEHPALLRMFVGHGLKLVAIGLVVGLAGAFALTRGMKTLLYGVNAADPLTYIGVSLGLAAAAALASYIPSRRAAAVDPVEALRAE